MSKWTPSIHVTRCHSKAGRFLYRLEHSSAQTQSYKETPIILGCMDKERCGFSCTTVKLVAKTRQVAVFNLYPSLQPIDNATLPFTTNSLKFATVTRKGKFVFHPCSVSVIFAFSAVKPSPCLPQ